MPLSPTDHEKYWTSLLPENAQQSKMRRGMGSPPLMCIFSADHPAEKKSHSNVTGSCVFVFTPPWKQFECLPLEADGSQWQLHCHNMLKWLILTGHILDFTFWKAAGMPESFLTVGGLNLIRPPWLQRQAARVAAGHSRKSKIYLCHSLNSSDIHGSSFCASIRTLQSAL